MEKIILHNLSNLYTQQVCFIICFRSENQSTVAQQGLKRSCTETGPINDYFTPKTPMDSVKKAKLSRSQNELATESKKNGIVSVANFFKPKK